MCFSALLCQNCQSLTDSAHEHCSNLAGKTSLEQAVNLIASCQAVVSNDSGLM
ncbi:hypothetical protein KDV41_21490, partial [Providencia stuartii]|uniref:glycosyltransferase family 9 protein n=1 Tax=Providencia stuartii TaxID=588 RepID=UPI00335DFEE4